MRFLMLNCLKYAQHCQNGIFKKMCRATTEPYSVMWVSPQYYVNILSMGNPLIPDRGVSRIFESGGSNISWFPKKRSSDFKRGGVQWSEGGGPEHLSH